jgi:hypothetical protein
VRFRELAGRLQKGTVEGELISRIQRVRHTKASIQEK